MTNAYSDFNISFIPTPRVVVPQGRLRIPRSVASLVGSAADNLIKWAAVQACRGSCASFDASGPTRRFVDVSQRLLFPKTIRLGLSAVEYYARIGMHLPKGLVPKFFFAEPDNQRMAATAHAGWTNRWISLIQDGIVGPLLSGTLNAGHDKVLRHYLLDFMWARSLLRDTDKCATAARALREVLEGFDVNQLQADTTLVEPSLAPSTDLEDRHFGLISVEPDLVLDTNLIELKATAEPRFTRQLFEQLLRYYLALTLQGFVDQAPPRRRGNLGASTRLDITHFGVSYLAAGQVVKWEVADLVCREHIDRCREAFASGTWARSRAESPSVRARKRQLTLLSEAALDETTTVRPLGAPECDIDDDFD